jgi:hypothetical protein
MPQALPVANITSENYETLARAFFDIKGTAFIIAIRNGVHTTGYEYKKTLMEWGAWRWWRRMKGFSVERMDEVGYYQAPTQWPSQFDAEVDPAAEQRAAGWFFDDYVAEQRQAMAERERRAGHDIPSITTGRPYPEPPLSTR